MRRSEPRPPIGGYAAKADPDWAWFYCAAGLICTYHKAIRFQTLIDKHGPDIGMDDILRRMRCPSCGHRGAIIRHPSWRDTQTGWQPFPGENA
jgi:hypothetical protein